MILDEDSYKRLTRKETIEWMRSISIEELADFIILYDYVEHASAQVRLPARTMILKDGDLYITYLTPLEIKIGYLSYEHRIEDEVIKNFYNKKEDRGKNILAVVAIGAICFLGGGLTFILASR